MLSTNCQLDFDPDFWSDFDVVMMQEWNISTITDCHAVDDYPSNLYAYKSLANRMLADTDSTKIAMQSSDFTTYINSILGQSQLDVQKEQVVFLTKYSNKIFQKLTASGVAYPTENLAFVKNNFEYSTAAVSHETLHLVLEEKGHGKSCYVDAVHENQFRYELKEMGKNKHPVIKKFDC
ncbi:MAG: hypothetical protein AB1351_03455 [Thermoproteota archaeon]